MAQMVPVAVPSKATPGEKALFRLLALLPDDNTVYYEAQIRHRYADFVVISPRLGVLMIEVKDWNPASILSADHDTIEIQTSSQAKKRKHPVKQARDYAFALKNEIESRLEGRILVRQEGPHSGSLAFPIGYAAVLSNISRDDVEKLGLGYIFDTERTLTSDRIRAMRGLNGDELERALSAYFVPKFQFAPLDQVQIDQLRGIIHPHIVVRSVTEKLRENYEDRDENFVKLLRVLDSTQEQKARNLGPGHRLLFGVAGSGKTVILIARAKYLAEQHADRRGLVLCFNRPLAAHLQNQLAGHSNLTVKTFHQLAHEFGIDVDESWDEVGEKLRAVIPQKDERYDFILVDEAQDFDPEWLVSVVALLKDQGEGDLFVTGDGSQTFYRHARKRFSWRSVGVRAQGRTEYLNENYRNARNIYGHASQFSGASAFGQLEEEHTAFRADPSRSVASGGSVVLIREKDRESEISRVVDLVSRLLAGQWEADANVRRINPPLACADIGIIYPSHKRREDLIAKSLIPRLKNECKAPCVWISDPKADNRSDVGSAIRIQTVHHAKGLQFRAVIFMWADLLPFARDLLPSDRNLFYVALTRAGQFLAVVHSGGSPLVDRLARSLSRRGDHEKAQVPADGFGTALDW